MQFTKKFQTQAKSWGLTEADAEDVYNQGQEVKTGMVVRKYGGYEIGVYYFLTRDQVNRLSLQSGSVTGVKLNILSHFLSSIYFLKVCDVTKGDAVNDKIIHSYHEGRGWC